MSQWNNWNRRQFVLGGGAALGATALPFSEAQSASYPTRPITLVVATKQGGGVDGVSRTVAPMMEKTLGGATINVVNKTGATGSIGGTFVYNKPNDGHWWFASGGFNRGLRALGLMDHTAWEHWQYFGADTSIMSLSVPPNSPYNSVGDLIKAAKKNPGKLRMSGNGLGGTWHLAASLLMSVTGTDFRFVPYKGGKPATTAALKGEVDVACSGLHEQLDVVKAGRLKHLAIAVSKPRKIQGVSLRAITEDVPELEGKTPVGGGMAMALRRDTPVAILKSVSKAWMDAVGSKEFHEKDMRKPRFPNPVVGADADKRAALWETVAANLLHGVGKAKKSPKDLGLPAIKDFESWWPPKGYKPRI
jgi:tripartite-type tricarboxylate transporter receptor subunit TctC